MQDSNSTYENLWFDPAHEKEYQIRLSGYTHTDTPQLSSWTKYTSNPNGYRTSYKEIGSYTDYTFKNNQNPRTSTSYQIACYLYFYSKSGSTYTSISHEYAPPGATRTGTIPKEATHYRCSFVGMYSGNNVTASMSSNYKLSLSYLETINEDSIISIRREDGIFTSDTDEIKFGQVIIGQLELSLKTDNKNYIARGNGLKPEIRLKKGNNKSSWYPQGEYFISTRSYDKETGVLTLHAFDALRKSEKEMYTDEGDQGNWPMTDINAVNTIAARLDVNVDARTTAIINQGYKVQYPGYKSGPDAEHRDVYYTIREVLGFIGAMYGGSWIISDEGKLRLIQFLDIPSAGNGYLINERNSRIIFGNNAILV